MHGKGGGSRKERGGNVEEMRKKIRGGKIGEVRGGKLGQVRGGKGGGRRGYAEKEIRG